MARRFVLDMDHYHYRIRSQGAIWGIANWGSNGILPNIPRRDIPIHSWVSQRQWIYRNFRYNRMGRDWRRNRAHALAALDYHQELAAINERFKGLRYYGPR